MLAELRIKNFAILDNLSLEFAPGFNVITGETGAGKSLVIEALSLLLGNKLANQYYGSESVISALIYPPNGEELVVSRRFTADGRSKVLVNGSLATVGQLAEQIKPLIAIHSQNDTHLLTKAERQLQILDCYAGEEHLQLLKQFNHLYQQWQTLKNQLNSLKALAGQADNLKELYSYQLQELKGARLTTGEDELLSQELSKWQSQVEITKGLSSCLAALETQIEPALDFLAKEITKVANFGLENELKQVEQLKDITNDLSFSLSHHLNSFDFNEASFNEKQERLYELNDLKRKYKMTLSELINYEKTVELELQKINNIELEINAKLPQEKEMFTKLTKIAAQLSKNRRQAAARISKEVEKVLIDLALLKAKFEVVILSANSEAEASLGPTGRDKVNFAVAFNPGQPLKSLSKVASGGELSRVMLALKSVVGKADNTPILVFDEIDAGVGGQTAVNVGLCLAKLARHNQVIAITHLPQIAAFAEHHLVIEKVFTAGKVTVHSRLVKESEQLEELTKLSGLLSNSKLDVAHARQLIEQAKKAMRVRP